MAIDANILLQGRNDQSQGLNALFQGINQFKNRDLTAQNKLFQKQGLNNQMEEAEFKSIYNAAKPLSLQLQSGDIDGARRSLEQRKESLKKIGLNTTQTDEGLESLSQDPSGKTLLNNVKQILTIGDQRFGNADKSTLFQPMLVINPDTGEPELVQASNNPSTPLKVLDRKPAKDTAEQASQRDVETFQTKENIKSGAEIGTKTKLAGIGRTQERVDSGVETAKGLPVLIRSIELLDSVQTGGFANAALRARQAFGVEGADEGELSANMGKSVLKQLKPTFGAAFTVEEGKELKRIEAGFGKSAATNRRLLNQLKQMAIRDAERGIKAAIELKDFSTAKDIQDLIDFKLEPQTETAPKSRFQIEEIK